MVKVCNERKDDDEVTNVVKVCNECKEMCLIEGAVTKMTKTNEATANHLRDAGLDKRLISRYLKPN